jgi:hypothetical protein
VTPRDSQKQALEAAVKELDRRISANRAAVSTAHTARTQAVSAAQSRISSVESQASSKESSYSPSAGCGCLIALGLFGLIFVYGIFPVGLCQQIIPACNDQTWAGNFKLVALLVAVAGLLWRPVAKLVTATLPASNIRSQLPELRRDLERVKSESEARLNQETAKLEAELQSLKMQKEQCQQALAKI